MQYLILFFSIINLLLGFIILIHSKHEKQNVTFLAFAFLSSLWTFNNFYLRLNPDVAILKGSYALGLVVATFGLVWVYFFLKKEPSFIAKFFIIPISGLFFGVTLFSDFVVQDLFSIQPLGYEGQLGPWFNLYSAFFTIVVFLIIYELIKQLRIEEDKSKRAQIRYVLFGATFFVFVSFIVSFLIPTFLHTLSFTVIDNFSFSFFLFAIVYAILKGHLFDIKVIVTEIFVFSLWAFILIRTILSDNIQDWIINTGLLVLTVTVGIFLIRSVLREVRQREKIEVLAKDLSETNDRQEKLIHFIGHEVKGYLTKGEYAFSEMIDGDFGQLQPETQVLATNALNELRKGVASVTDILKAANLKRGTVTYEMKPVDLRDLVQGEVLKLRPAAQEKGLTLDAGIDANETYMINADKNQLAEHVIRNLIDNSIKYTPKGTVTVGLVKKDGKILFTIKDTGVGIADEDKARLFTEGGHGKESIKVNVHSTGYGLYIAKQIVEAHGGKIWAQSDGPGKGSEFFIEFPAV